MARRPLNSDMVRRAAWDAGLLQAARRRGEGQHGAPRLRALPPPLPAPRPVPHRRPVPMAQEALRNYVLADCGAQNQAESTVRLVITHSNLRASFMDIRLDLHVRGGGGGGQRGTAGQGRAERSQSRVAGAAAEQRRAGAGAPGASAPTRPRVAPSSLPTSWPSCPLPVHTRR